MVMIFLSKCSKYVALYMSYYNSTCSGDGGFSKQPWVRVANALNLNLFCLYLDMNIFAPPKIFIFF